MPCVHAVYAFNNKSKPFITRYLDICPKNDVTSFSRKDFCALGLVLEEIRLNTLSAKRPFGQEY